jgi:hypothetical protein
VTVQVWNFIIFIVFVSFGASGVAVPPVTIVNVLGREATPAEIPTAFDSMALRTLILGVLGVWLNSGFPFESLCPGSLEVFMGEV